MTSEAPQDVAALPLEPESPIVQAWNAWRRSPEGADGSRAEAFVAGWQAAAGLLDQNDRLRARVEALEESLRLLSDVATVQRTGCSHKGIGQPGCVICDPRVWAVLRGSGAEEAARNE